MKLRPRFLALLLVGSVGFGLSACSAEEVGGADPTGPTVVRVAYPPTTAWLPAWVAYEQGFFADHDLDVQFTSIQNVSTTIGALGQQFDIVAQTPPDLIQAVSKGLPVVGVAGNSLETPDASQFPIVVGADSGIADFGDLDGRTVATPTVSGMLHVSLLYSVLTAGGDPSSITAVEVPFPNMGDQLAAGNVDAVESAFPAASPILATGATSIGSPLAVLGDEVVPTIWMSNSTWAAENPDAVANWKIALGEAAEWIAANDSEAKAILAEYTGLPDVAVANLTLPPYNFDLPAESLQVWIDAMVAIGVLNDVPDAATLVVE